MSNLARSLAPLLVLAAASACSGSVGNNDDLAAAAPGAPVPGAPSPGAPAAIGTPGAPGAAGASAVGVVDPNLPPETEWMPPVDGAVFTGPIVANPAAQTRFPRLTHNQWERTVMDLLGLDEPLGLSDAFVGEPLLSRFDNNGALLTVSADMWLDYQRAAEAVGSFVAQDTELVDALIPDAPTEPAARARAFVQTIGERAYRRPLTETEVTRLLALFDAGATLLGGDPFSSGVELVTTFLLQSPHFLYRAELSSDVVDGKILLNGYEVASRLSYGLLNTMPDDQLLDAAAAGTLQAREQVIAHATRLLESAAIEDTVSDFHLQLLHMQDYLAVSKNDDLIGDDSGQDLQAEALTFSREVVLGQDGGFLELLTAPYTYGNGRISEIYGEDALTPRPEDADDFARIDLDPSRRAGLLTQIGFLAANAEGATPNSIMRGVHIAHRVICAPLPPPPDMIPEFPELSPDQTNRERVEVLTGEPACAGCHGVFINPLGFALEHFDGLGQYRDTDNDRPVDASSTYTFDGVAVSFDGAAQLAAAIAQSQQANDCYAANWVEYVFGRVVSESALSDANLVAQAGALSKGGASVKDLIVQLVANDAFLTRLP